LSDRTDDYRYKAVTYQLASGGNNTYWFSGFESLNITPNCVSPIELTNGLRPLSTG
jgi:hypothetical protein